MIWEALMTGRNRVFTEAFIFFRSTAATPIFIEYGKIFEASRSRRGHAHDDSGASLAELVKCLAEFES
jgi:hypothetical protein